MHVIEGGGVGERDSRCEDQPTCVYLCVSVCVCVCVCVMMRSEDEKRGKDGRGKNYIERKGNTERRKSEKKS